MRAAVVAAAEDVADEVEVVGIEQQEIDSVVAVDSTPSRATDGADSLEAAAGDSTVVAAVADPTDYYSAPADEVID